MCIEVVVVDSVGGRRNFTLFLTCNGNGDGNGNGYVNGDADAGVSRIALPILRIVELKILKGDMRDTDFYYIICQSKVLNPNKLKFQPISCVL